MMKKIFKIIALSLMVGGMLSPIEAMATKGEVTTDNVKVRRQGKNLIVAMDLVLDGLKVGSNEQVTFRPVVSAGENRVVMDPIVVYGRNQELKIQRNPTWATPDAQNLRRRNGTSQRVAVCDTVAWEPWMEVSNVSLSEDLCGCGYKKGTHEIPVAEIDYAPAPAPLMCYITPQAEAVKDRDESGQAFLDFIVNKTDIRPDYRNNRVELRKIINTINLVKDDPFVTITNINIHGFASPEGTYDNNERLATGRAAALKNYVKGLYDLPDKVFTSNATPEDWDNLRKLIENSNMPEKVGLLNIIDTTVDPDARDHEMRKQYPQAYAMMLRDWYPGLRRSDYKVSYVVRPLTIEEAKQVLKSNPKNLSLNEMFLVAQTYQPGSKEFNDVFETAVRIFPDDPTANLNAACIALNNGDLKRAGELLAKAGDTPEADHARGLLAMKQGRYDEARTLLTKAKKAGIKQAEENLTILDRTERIARDSQD